MPAKYVQKLTLCAACGRSYNSSALVDHLQTNKHKHNVQQLAATNDNKLNTNTTPNTTPIVNKLLTH